MQRGVTVFADWDGPRGSSEMCGVGVVVVVLAALKHSLGPLHCVASFLGADSHEETAPQWF